MADSRAITLTSPAEVWNDGFPIGNGRIGAMVFGGVPVERLALNHEDLWRGKHSDRTTRPCHEHLSEIRKKLFAREWEAADRPGSVNAPLSLDRIPDPECDVERWSDGSRVKSK